MKASQLARYYEHGENARDTTVPGNKRTQLIRDFKNDSRDLSSMEIMNKAVLATQKNNEAYKF